MPHGCGHGTSRARVTQAPSQPGRPEQAGKQLEQAKEKGVSGFGFRVLAGDGITGRLSSLETGRRRGGYRGAGRTVVPIRAAPSAGATPAGGHTSAGTSTRRVAGGSTPAPPSRLSSRLRIRMMSDLRMDGSWMAMDRDLTSILNSGGETRQPAPESPRGEARSGTRCTCGDDFVAVTASHWVDCPIAIEVKERRGRLELMRRVLAELERVAPYTRAVV